MPELPAAVGYLWKWYIDELQTGERLTWQELRAWSDICKKDISETEAQALRNLSLIHHKIINTPPK